MNHHLLEMVSQGTVSTMENQPIVASYQNFHVIAHDLDEKGNLKAACKEKLGVGVRRFAIGSHRKPQNTY